MSDDLIEFQEAPRSNFTMIPNLVDDMNLDPYAFRLYCHLRRVAGEQGRCWRSGETLARECCMSTGQVSEAKRVLATTNPPLILIKEIRGEHGKCHSITICDIWQQNAMQFVKPSYSEGKPSPREPLPSHSETIKNPLLRSNDEDVGAQSLDAGSPSESAPTSPGKSAHKRDRQPPEDSSGLRVTAPAVPLLPQSDEERLLFQMAAQNTPPGRRPPRAQFQNAQQASDFRAAAQVLNGETRRVLEAFSRGGGGGLGKAVSYVCGAARKRQATPPPEAEYQPPMFFAPTSWEEA